MQNTSTHNQAPNQVDAGVLFMKAQREAITKRNTKDLDPKVHKPTDPIQKKKKKSKKKRKSSYKQLLRSMTKSTKSDEQKKKEYKNKLSQSLGGGRFNKIDSI